MKQNLCAYGICLASLTLFGGRAEGTNQNMRLVLLAVLRVIKSFASEPRIMSSVINAHETLAALDTKYSAFFFFFFEK